MKRKPREPNKHYWLDLPIREPLSFCQANSASALHSPTPTPPPPSLSFFQTFFVFWGMAAVTWFSGWEPTESVAMVAGKCFVPCASKGTFPLLEFLPSLQTAQWNPFSFACQHTCSSRATLLWRKGKAVLQQLPAACLHPLCCGHTTSVCPAYTEVQPPCLPLPVISEVIISVKMV